MDIQQNIVYTRITHTLTEKLYLIIDQMWIEIQSRKSSNTRMPLQECSGLTIIVIIISLVVSTMMIMKSKYHAMQTYWRY